MNLLACCAFASPDAARAAVYNIKNHSAVGDGIAMNTVAAQRAIEDDGGGTLRLPAGKFQIGTVRLKSHVRLSLGHARV